MERSNKFLEFGEDNVFFLDQETKVDHIAIEPICRFFGADVIYELKQLQDTFVKDELQVQRVVNNGRFEDMVFMPIQYVIGWIVTLNVPPSRRKGYLDEHKFFDTKTDNN